MELLILHKADVNMVDRHGKTALMLTAITNNVACVELLIASQADIGKKNKVSTVRSSDTPCFV